MLAGKSDELFCTHFSPFFLSVEHSKLLKTKFSYIVLELESGSSGIRDQVSELLLCNYICHILFFINTTIHLIFFKHNFMTFNIIYTFSISIKMLKTVYVFYTEIYKYIFF